MEEWDAAESNKAYKHLIIQKESVIDDNTGVWCFLFGHDINFPNMTNLALRIG